MTMSAEQRGARSRCACGALITWTETPRGLVILSEMQSFKLDHRKMAVRTEIVLVNHADICSEVRKLKKSPVPLRGPIGEDSEP